MEKSHFATAFNRIMNLNHKIRIQIDYSSDEYLPISLTCYGKGLDLVPLYKNKNLQKAIILMGSLFCQNVLVYSKLSGKPLYKMEIDIVSNSFDFELGDEIDNQIFKKHIGPDSGDLIIFNEFIKNLKPVEINVLLVSLNTKYGINLISDKIDIYSNNRIVEKTMLLNSF